MDEVFFITFNGLGQMLSIVKNAIIGFTECEVSTVIDLGSVRVYLMIVAGSVLGLIILFVTFYAISIDKTLNALWEFLRKRIHYNYINTKHALLERLSECHHKSDLDTEYDLNQHKTTTPIHFRHYIRYLGKLSVILICIAVFFSLTSSYFFENIYNHMYYKPRFIYTIIERRIALTEMLFFTYENEIQDTDKSLNAMFPQFNLFTDPAGCYMDAFNSLNLTKSVLRDPNTIMLLSPAVEKQIFWSYPNSSAFESIGMYSGSAFLMLESHFIVFNEEVDSPQVIGAYMLMIRLFILTF